MDFPAQPTLREGFEAWNAELPRLVKAGLKSNPLWKQAGGLESVDAGMELLKGNKVSRYGVFPVARKTDSCARENRFPDRRSFSLSKL